MPDHPTPPAPTIARVVVVTRFAAVASVVALAALGVGWELVWARTGHGALVIKVLPLVAALPGLLKRRLYTCRWLSLCVWLYVAEGLVRLGDAPPVRGLALAEVALSLVLFAACATQVRWRLAAARRPEPPPADDPGVGADTAR